MMSKYLYISLLVISLALASCQRTRSDFPSPSGVSTPFPSTGEGLGKGAGGATPIKNQGHTSACWIYAYLACIETERIEHFNDSMNLSPLWLICNAMHEQSMRRYLTGGRSKISCRGIGPEAEHLMKQYGMVPYSFFHMAEDMSSRKMERDIAMKTDIAMRMKKGLSALHDDVAAAMPRMPHNLETGFYLYGMHYTPLQFSNSLLAGTSMRWLTSYTHHPFYEPFALEIPDNYRLHSIMNLPIDSLYASVITALEHRHPVFWEGKMPAEMSETGVKTEGRKSTDALLPTAKNQWNKLQSLRQRAFERREVTDDHAMAIIGMVRDKQGKPVFICKNSWGKEWGDHGYCYMKAEDFLMNTVLVGVIKSPT